MNERDRRLVKEVTRRVRAGSTSHKTHKRKRGPFGGGGEGESVVVLAHSPIPPATESGGYIEPSITSVRIANWHEGSGTYRSIVETAGPPIVYKTEDLYNLTQKTLAPSATADSLVALVATYDDDRLVICDPEEERMAQGMLVSTIGPATFDGANKTATPGETPLAVVVMKWNSAGTQLIQDTDYGAAVTGVNLGRTGARGSVAHPLVVDGKLRKFNDGYKFILNPRPIDSRILPDWAIGATPTGDDDPDLQIIHSKGGSELTEMDSEQCSGGS